MAAEEYHEAPPPRVKPSVIGAPKIRQMYWCRLPTDAELPELWKVRPVVVISYRNTLTGHVTVVPTTTVQQDDNEWAYKLTTNLGRPSWAICDKPMTVAVSRLRRFRYIPRVTQPEFDGMLRTLYRWLPVPAS